MIRLYSLKSMELKVVLEDNYKTNCFFVIFLAVRRMVIVATTARGLNAHEGPHGMCVWWSRKTTGPLMVFALWKILPCVII